MAIEEHHIICDKCGLKFERGIKNQHCSNCYACTGCEIYYCPQCDERIVVKPVRKMNFSSKKE